MIPPARYSHSGELSRKQVSGRWFARKGKYEPFKCALTGYWSRCVTEEYRLVYKVTDEGILIVQLRYNDLQTPL